MATAAQSLVRAALFELNVDAEQALKDKAKFFIREIAHKQKQIASLQESIEKCKAELKALSFEPLKAEEIL